MTEVLYTRCPHCGKGWYGAVKYIEVDIDGEIYKGSPANFPKEKITELSEVKILHYVIEGMTDVDITNEIMCLNCHNKYTPINSEGTMLMDDWVAHKVCTITGC